MYIFYRNLSKTGAKLQKKTENLCTYAGKYGKMTIIPTCRRSRDDESSFHDSCLNPLFGKCFGVSKSSVLINLILVEQQLGEVFWCEAFTLLNFLPKVCRRLVHTDDVAEVDVLFAFGHDNLLSTDVSQVKSFFCFHYSNGYLVLN